MLLSCKCLNVHLEVDAVDDPVTIDTLQLHAALAQDVFFNQEIRQVLRLSKVTKMLPMHVQHRSIENWSLEQCLNCNMHTHAMQNADKGPAYVFVNAHLLTNPQIEALQKHRLYSKVYKVLIFETSEAERRYDYLPADVENSIRALKQKADESIQLETMHNEERVRIFTEQQAQLLENYAERARADQKMLTRVLLKHQLTPNLTTVRSMPQQHQQHISTGAVPRRCTKLEEHMSASSLRKVPDDFDRIKTPSPQHKVLTISDEIPTSFMKKHTNLHKKNSLDSECLFDIEGMDEVEESQPLEFSDSEDNGIPIKQNRHSRQRSQQDYSIAKSLPMNIPVYMTSLRHQTDDSDEETVQSDRDKDIAASIQALARSVNGDTVFGDLPRPRCRTNIM